MSDCIFCKQESNIENSIVPWEDLAVQDAMLGFSYGILLLIRKNIENALTTEGISQLQKKSNNY